MNPTGIDTETDVGALVAAAQQFADTEQFSVDKEGHLIVVTAAGRTVQSVKRFIDEYRLNPERKRGISEISRVESFIAHVKRHANPKSSVIYADVVDKTAPKLIAVYNAHEAGPDGAGHFGDWRAVYQFPVSEEWRLWTAISSTPLDQAKFAAFLEERILDVVDPKVVGESINAFAATLGIALAAPQRILTVSKGLTITVGSKVTQHVNLSTGEMRIGFEQQHGSDDPTAPLMVPGGFAIGIPVFRAGALYQMGVRLRYKVQNGQVIWTMAVQQIDAVWDHAIDETVFLVGEKTALPLFYGKPESRGDR